MTRQLGASTTSTNVFAPFDPVATVSPNIKSRQLNLFLLLSRNAKGSLGTPPLGGDYESVLLRLFYKTFFETDFFLPMQFTRSLIRTG